MPLRRVILQDGMKVLEPVASTGTSAFKYIGATQPITTAWAVNDLWLDTSDPDTDGNVIRRWTGSAFSPVAPAAPDPTGSLLLADDFTGTDGAAWNSSKWGLGRAPTLGTGGGATLLSGQGQLAASNYGNYAGESTVSRRALLTARTDANIFFRFKWDSTSGFLAVHQRHSTTTVDRKDGYMLLCNKPANVWGVYKLDGSYVSSVLTSEQALTWVDGAIYAVRFKCAGTSIKGKVWLNSTTEPGSWTVDTTDSTYSSAGYIGLSMAGGATSTLPRRAFVDDLVILDA